MEPVPDEPFEYSFGVIKYLRVMPFYQIFLRDFKLEVLERRPNCPIIFVSFMLFISGISEEVVQEKHV